MNIVYSEQFDVIVIGGGHAGTEAAAISAKMGANTLLLTHNIETIGQMSCNPAIGGIGKGHLVKEIDALGGIMGRAIDRSGIQFRTLNSSKGHAVRATRAQADRSLYKKSIKEMLESYSNLTILQQSVKDLIIEKNKVKGVITDINVNFFSKTTILTVGTFLGGKIHIGTNSQDGGRAGDSSSNLLSKKLRELPFNISRLKTGTPPRIDRRSVDFTKMETQDGDKVLPFFSFFHKDNSHPKQIPCHITYTNEKTHSIICKNIDKSAMYNGNINSIGPRYCPSIEDKVIRFSDKNRHQVFIEPEGLDSMELYPNGLSTSLPFDVQLKFINSIKGLENAIIMRPGYAIEYDFFDPRNLMPTLETKYIENLFFAGQINGTTGYEEAAAQGLIAGINATLTLQNKKNWTPQRNEAYIGVLIDDLITKGTQEPYRMFTSRAEFRLILREDNADIRLCPKAIELGLINGEEKSIFLNKKNNLDREYKFLTSNYITPGSKEAKILNISINKKTSLFDLLKRPNFSYENLCEKLKIQPKSIDIKEQIIILAKYDGYIQRQEKEVKLMREFNRYHISLKFDYNKVPSLSSEAKEKLDYQKPSNLGEASRIPGITPADISLLKIYMKKAGFLKKLVH